MESTARDLQINQHPNIDVRDSQNAKPTVPNRGIIPDLLRKRLQSRTSSRLFWIISMAFNICLIILCGLHFDCYYYTRKYITDGDYFWEFNIDHDLKNKAIPLSAILTGMICILTFFFNLMNQIVIGLYIIFGGVRDRITFASKLFVMIIYTIYLL